MGTMRPLVLATAALALAGAPAFGSEVFRCTVGGSVTYQELPCVESAREEKLGLPSSFPEVNTARRDELLAREAALDKRLEAERERLSREKIASVQAAAQVAAARALAAPPVEPVYYPALPYWRPHVAHAAPRRAPSNTWNPWSPR